MPKEIVYDVANTYDVHIGWTRDGQDVQVGIETHDGRSIGRHLYEGGIDDQTPEEANLAGFSGLWGTLDRVGVNRAIRTLRRARDEAFGKDE